jgi:hypothetical protein
VQTTRGSEVGSENLDPFEDQKVKGAAVHAALIHSSQSPSEAFEPALIAISNHEILRDELRVAEPKLLVLYKAIDYPFEPVEGGFFSLHAAPCFLMNISSKTTNFMLI